jgi:Family of unknown function (DUF5946)
MTSILEPCPGCGALFHAIDGPTHRYVGASAGCWEVFGRVQASHYEGLGSSLTHRLTVDTYMVQHPGTPSPQSIQSVAVHLITLYFLLEQGLDPRKAADVTRVAADHPPTGGYVWLDPPFPLGSLTILEVEAAKDEPEHDERIMQWARSVWEAWSPYHETVRRWATLLP